MLAERNHAWAEYRAIARENEIALELPVIRHAFLLPPPVRAQCAKIEVSIDAAPAAINTSPSAREKRAVVFIFSIAISAPSAAIQMTFITPTANIKSIIAQQQPRQ